MFFVSGNARADIASVTYVKNITGALEQSVSDVNATATSAKTTADQAVANWGKIPVKDSGGVETTTAQIWVE